MQGWSAAAGELPDGSLVHSDPPAAPSTHSWLVWMKQVPWSINMSHVRKSLVFLRYRNSENPNGALSQESWILLLALPLICFWIIYLSNSIS